MKISRKAFSLIELSIVILIIGILIAGITQSSRLVKKFRLQSAQNLTQSSPVVTIENLLLWYESVMEDSFSTTEAIDGNTVTTWFDHNPRAVAANKINASQLATPGSRPLYIEEAIGGAIPALRFGTVGTPDDTLLFDGSALANSNYTVFIVEQRRIIAPTRMYMISGSDGTNNTNLHFGYENNTVFRFSHFGSDLNFGVEGYTTPTPKIHTGRMSTTDGRTYWENGGGALTPDANNLAMTNVITSYNGSNIGHYSTGPAYYIGDIAEIIIFTRALKTEERQSIENYLSKKYSIKLSP